ncbi:MAG: hypothetical protein GC192_21360 [Bacteroidetes bacterium]|nr:hypothetical protein [Bacteroidota bacterium]
MKVEFKQVTIHFDYTSGIRQREPGTATFSGRVLSAEAMLKGYQIKFKDSNRPFFEQEVDIDITGTSGNRVDVAADFVLRDASGNLDDRYGGYVQCVVVAVVE